MILTTALTIAEHLTGCHPVLVGRRRPTVSHVHVGVLHVAADHDTLYVPRRQRPVCGARTRRLYAITPARRAPRLCRRCSTTLQARGTHALPAVRSTEAPMTRAQVQLAYADHTLADLRLKVLLAGTRGEVLAAQNIAWAVHGLAATQKPTVLPDGRPVEPLDQVAGPDTAATIPTQLRRITAAETADASPPPDEDLFWSRIADAERRAAAARKQRRAERQHRIDQVGITNATAHERPRTASRQDRGRARRSTPAR